MAHTAPEGRPELRVVESWTDSGPVYTVKDVADACGLPQPVIAQVVPRTWTDDGWMYTGAQIRSAIDIAQKLRRDADRDEGLASSAMVDDAWPRSRKAHPVEFDVTEQ